LVEKNVDDWKLESIDMMKGQHKSPEYLQNLQPFGQIPVLEDGDVKIFESRAIARYICDKHESQGTKLFGSSLKERALVNQWIEVESQNYNPAVSSIVFQIVFTPMFGLKRNDAVVDEQVAKLEKVLDVYETQLSKSKYLAGDFFSMADLSHLPYTNLLVNATDKAEVITSRPHVHAWWKDISSRPSFTKVLGFQKQ